MPPATGTKVALEENRADIGSIWRCPRCGAEWQLLAHERVTGTTNYGLGRGKMVRSRTSTWRKVKNGYLPPPKPRRTALWVTLAIVGSVVVVPWLLFGLLLIVSTLR